MSDAPLIPFTRGAPSIDIVDTEGLSAAATRAFAEDPAGTCGYGTAGGYGPLREWIAQRHGVDVGQVLVTNGSMQADAFLFELLVRPGDPVVVESPSYDRTLLNLVRRGGDLHPVPVDGEGLDTAALEKELVDGLRPTLAHVIPNFQNPAGATLSGPRRERVLELAERHRFVVFEDDPYIEIRFEGEDLPTMLSSDRSDRVVYASSFSKTVCPGIRCGYLVGPEALISDVAGLATTTYISPNMVAQSVVNQFVRSERMAPAVAGIRSALRARRDALVEALREHLPEAVFTIPEGGYFLWVDLGEDVDVDLLAEVAPGHGVAFVKGSDFVVDGGRHAIRLAYSALGPDQITEGVVRLGAAVREARAVVA